MSGSRGASNHRCSRDARVKGHFSGALLSPAAENPLGRIAAAEDPSAERGGEGSVARSRHDNLPSSPSKASGRAFSKDTGVSTIYNMGRHVGSGGMVSTSPPGFSGDRARTPPKLESNGTRDEGCQHVH